MTDGIEPNRDPGSRALKIGPGLKMNWPGSFNAPIQDVSQRANSWVGSSAARKVLTEKDGLTALAIYRETDTGRDYEWGGPAIGWRRYQASQKLFTFRRTRNTVPADNGRTPIDPGPGFTYVIGGNIPAALLKAGEWEVTTAGRWRADTGTTIGYAQVLFGGVNLTGDMQYDLSTTSTESLASVSRHVLTGDGTQPAAVELRVSTANQRVRLYDVGIALSARYVGPLS